MNKNNGVGGQGVPRRGRYFPRVTDFLTQSGDTTVDQKKLSRACLVTNELAELHQNGGIGTACSGLIQSLRTHGVYVHVIYTGAVDIASDTARQATLAFERRGVSISFLQRVVPEFWMHEPRRISYACYELLRTMEHEIILFNDYLGNGFYAAQAKQLGFAFRGVPIVTTIHGPTRWACQADERPIAGLYEEELCVLEAKAVEYSDAVIGVSNYILEWLHNNGVVLPELTFVHKNTLPDEGLSKGHGQLTVRELKEVVYFARHDVRKGIRVFVDAVRRLSRSQPHLKFTFLGKFARIGGEHSGAMVLDELRSVSNIVDFRHDYDRDQAINYLKRPGVLAVMPSLDENSPCTVVECIQAGVAFITSDVGGVRELLHADSHDSILFKPTGAELAERIEQIFNEGIRTAELAFEPAKVARERIAFLKSIVATVGAADAKRAASVENKRPLVSICITHYNRGRMLATLLRELENQSYDSIEIVIVDDGSTVAEDVEYFASLKSHRFPLKTLRIPNSFLGAARNAAVALAQGEYVKFQDDDNLPLPDEVETFVRAANWSNADVLTAFSYFFKTEQDLLQPRSFRDVEYLPLGACLPLALFRNDYGDANALVRRSAFAKLNGFTELRGVGAEDYEFFARAEVAGYKIRTIPKPLFYYRITEGSMLQQTSLYANAKRAKSAFSASSASWVDQLIDFAQNLQLNRDISAAARDRAAKRRFGELHLQLLEGSPNDTIAISRFIELASRYERLEDILHLVMRSRPICESLAWIERSAEELRTSSSRRRQFLVSRPQVLELSRVREVELIEPKVDLPEFPLTHTNEAGVLVHPLLGRETSVQIVRYVPRGTRRLTLVCLHAGEQGRPLRMAFDVLATGQPLGRSEWIEIAPKQQVEIVLELAESLPTLSDLRIKSAIFDVPHFAWAYAQRLIVEGHFTE